MFTETKRNIADRLSILSIHDEIENELSNNLETEANMCIGGMSYSNSFHNTEVFMKTWILTTPSDDRKGIAVAALFQYFNENGTLKVPMIRSTYYGILYSDIRQLQWVRPNIKSRNESEENNDTDLSSVVQYIPCLEIPYDQKIYTDEGYEKIVKTKIDDGANYTEYTRNAIEEYVKSWNQEPTVIHMCDKEGQIPINDLESVDIEDLIDTCLIGDRKPKLDIIVSEYSEYLYKHFNRDDNRYDIDDDTKEIIETAMHDIIYSTVVPFYQDFNMDHYYVNMINHVVYDPNRDNNSSTN